MSMAYFNLYKRLIKRKSFAEEIITEMVDDAHTKDRLIDGEYNQLIELINQYYDEPEPNAIELEEH